MNIAIVLLKILGFVIGYSFLAGWTAGQLKKHYFRKCYTCRNKEKVYCGDAHELPYTAGWVAWPITWFGWTMWIMWIRPLTKTAIVVFRAGHNAVAIKPIVTESKRTSNPNLGRDISQKLERDISQSEFSTRLRIRLLLGNIHLEPRK